MLSCYKDKRTIQEILTDIQADRREVIKSKWLLHLEEIHFMKASWNTIVTEIHTF